jgi:uncharacterized damage-inducible protein DinB
MSDNVYTLIEVADGCRSAEGARFLSQLRDGHRALREVIEGLSAQDLAWQHAPGFNTIGMLLAHIALNEVHLIQVGVEGAKNSRIQETLGIGEDDDGMPIAADGTPPATLAGKDLAYYRSLLDRALAVSEEALRNLEDADFDRRITRPRPQGGERVLNVRWTLHHILEHLFLHHGQIGLIKHLRSRA